MIDNDFAFNEDYELVRSKRKTLSLSVSKELKVVVRSPLRTSARDIEEFIYKHTSWIEKQIDRIKQRKDICLSDEEILQLKQKAKMVLPLKVQHFSEIMGVSPISVKITSATTRWGSCSGKNGICFSYKIMLLPDELIDYIVVHELAHIVEKNHSHKFYAVIERYLPNYRELVAQIKNR